MSTMRWSIGIKVATERVMTQEEVVDLADAVASSQGIATGIGTKSYGAQIVVLAASREGAIAKGKETFAAAVKEAGLPIHPIVEVQAISEAEDAGPGY